MGYVNKKITDNEQGSICTYGRPIGSTTAIYEKRRCSDNKNKIIHIKEQIRVLAVQKDCYQRQNQICLLLIILLKILNYIQKTTLV